MKNNMEYQKEMIGFWKCLLNNCVLLLIAGVTAASVLITWGGTKEDGVVEALIKLIAFLFAILVVAVWKAFSNILKLKEQ